MQYFSEERIMDSSKNRNVLIAAMYASGNSGNFIGSMIELLEAMRLTDRKVYFIFPKNENTLCQDSWVKWLEREGGHVFLVEKGLSDDEQLLFLRKIIAEESIGILHLHFGLFQNLAITLRKELRVRVIIHEHMSYPVGCNRVTQTMKYMVRSVIYRVHDIVYVSVSKRMYNAHVFCKRYYIPNGLSMKRNILKSLSREELREQLMISNDEQLVLLLGWAYQLKGLDIAVRAVSECRKRGHSVILGTIGVDLENENVKKFIEEKTGISTSEAWIKPLPGGEDIFSYHRAIDVYLSASRSEAFPYGILETISQNTPIALSDIVETRWCREYSKAFMYPVEDYVKCADAIEKAILVGRADSNYMDICEKYSIDRWCKRIIQVYNTI